MTRFEWTQTECERPRTYTTRALRSKSPLLSETGLTFPLRGVEERRRTEDAQVLIVICPYPGTTLCRGRQTEGWSFRLQQALRETGMERMGEAGRGGLIAAG